MLAPRVVLVILDGFGERAEPEANAIRLARTPILRDLYARYPATTLEASGNDVGLPAGLMGNSEVGHLNLGAGRIVYQDIVRIDRAIATGEFFENPVLAATIDAARASGGTLHLFGLTSSGGVHSSLDHAYAICEMARRRGLSRVAWHAFLDGRDTPPTSAAGFLRDVAARLSAIGVGRIASAIGRFYPMDRDNRWDRIEVAWRMLVRGQGRACQDAAAAVEAGYAAGETDEFCKPLIVTGRSHGGEGEPVGLVRDGDACFFWNFRADRARQLTRAFTATEWPYFDRGPLPALSAWGCMTVYDESFALPAAFPRQRTEGGLGEVLSRHGLAQLRTAETEKYAHVTYFFNGGVEEPFPGEQRQLVPSNRSVATYDLAPEMSAVGVTDAVVDGLRSGGPAFILVNYANPDMLGHTGMLGPAVQGIEVIDRCLGRIVAAAAEAGAAVLLTADHGNCELMPDPVTGEPHTAHTTNRVPFLAIGPAFEISRAGRQLRAGGRLCDVAPTVLEVLGLPQPREMDGQLLLVPERAP